MKTDTIAAIATALSESGIGIVRISGKEAVEIADKIFRNKKGEKKLAGMKSHTIHYGYIVDAESEDSDWQKNIIDEVMVAIMKAPYSYTTEDTIEINCHGGVLVVRRVLETVLKSGARMAQPGEFTKRAFLNGRIDLSRAEAVIDVIHSRNQWALEASINHLKGDIAECIKKLRQEILYEIAFIESALDDPEHISLEGYQNRLTEKNERLLISIKKLLMSAESGKLRMEGINTVIVGKPNAGKSSLLNILVGEERAIVTEIAGTTRDVLQENIQIQGIGLNIIDTAGIRNTQDIVEKIGVEKAKKYAADADLIVYVVDTSVPLDESDREIASFIQEKKTIILLNKTDLDCKVDENQLLEMMHRTDAVMIRTSTKENTGIDVFADTIQNLFFKGELVSNNEVVITNMRHKAALQEAYDSLLQVKKSLIENMPEDFYSIDLMSAYAALGTIIGEEVGEDLVNEIFSKFCMGK